MQVVVENRVEQQGVKHQYTQNWQTLPDITEFINIVDGRVNSFFNSISKQRAVCDASESFNVGDEKLEHRTVRLAKRGANINLTGKQAQEILRIIREYGYDSAPVGMPLREFPFGRCPPWAAF